MAVKLTLKTINRKIIREFNQNIKSLNLSCVEFTIFPKINIFKNLRSLNMSNNKISIIPPEIGELINLTSLILNDNKIIQLPVEICKLIQLEYLSLNNNRLKILPKINTLTKLKHLSLGNNELIIGPNVQLPNLSFVFLYYNRLKFLNLLSENIGYLGIGDQSIIFIYTRVYKSGEYPLILIDDV